MEWLHTLNEGDTKLASHCDKNKTPIINLTAGSLGQDHCASRGLALANKIDPINSWKGALIGDRETDKKQNREATLFAPHHKLTHLIAFTD